MPIPEALALASPWLSKLFNVNGDQTNQAQLSQMNQQAGGDQGFNIPSALLPNDQYQKQQRPSPQSPAVVPPPTPRSSFTAQPTTTPLGYPPQEMVPDQRQSLIDSKIFSNASDYLAKKFKEPPHDNSALMQLMQNGDKSYGEGMQSNLENIKLLKDQLNKYAHTDQGYDYTPLAAFLDSRFGGNLTQAAKEMAPETPAQKLAHQQEMQMKIAEFQGRQPGIELEHAKNQMQQQGYIDERAQKDAAAKEEAAAKVIGSAGQLQRSQLMGQRMDLQTSKDAGAVGSAYEHDPILKASKMSKNSIDRAISILNNTSKPVTATDLNLAYNDYINSVAVGGAATEGKISRELPENWDVKWNMFKQEAGKIDDLRKSPVGAELIDMLKNNMAKVKDDLKTAVAEQATNIHSNYLNSTNQKAIETNKRKLKEYAPDAYNQMYDPQAIQDEHNSAIEWAKKNPNDLAAKKILSLHGM